MVYGKLARTAGAALAGAALVLSLGACSSSSSTTTSSTTTEAETTSASSSSSSSDFDAVAFYTGKWRASVETTSESVYGTTGGTESMLDLDIEDDGTFTTTPLENHEDLLTTSGTWEGTEDTLTLTCEDGTTIELTVTGDTAMEGDPTLFKIDGFDVLNFVLY